MKPKSVFGLSLLYLILFLWLAGDSEAASCNVPNISIPPSYELRDSLCFHVGYTDGSIYSAYRVVYIESDPILTGPAIDFDYQLARLYNWLVLDSEGKIVQDAAVYQDIVIAADTAYVINRSQGMSYSGIVPLNLWTPQAMQDKANEWIYLVGLSQVLDFLQVVGNTAGAGITAVLTGGSSEAVKIPVREVVKRVAKELLTEAITEYAKGQVTPGGAYKNALRASALAAAGTLHAEAGKNIVIEVAGTVDFQEMMSFRGAVPGAMGVGHGSIMGLHQFYDGGLCQYFEEVIKESVDLIGAIDIIDELILIDPSVADAMNAVVTYAASAQVRNNGLLAGALEVQNAFLNANKTLSIQVVTDKGTYKPTESITVSVSLRDHYEDPIDADSVSFAVKDNSDVTKLQDLCTQNGTGSYTIQFAADELDGYGEYTVEILAQLANYHAGTAFCSFTVSQGAFLSCSPPSYSKALTKNAQHIDQITVSNTVSMPANVSVSTAGNIASWITPLEQSFVLHGVSSHVLNFTINVPSTISDGDYTGTISLAYDDGTLGVPVLIQVKTPHDDLLASIATIDGDFAPESPDQMRPLIIYKDVLDHILTDATSESARYADSFLLTSNQFDRLILMNNSSWIKKTYEIMDTHYLGFWLNDQLIWGPREDADPSVIKNITETVREGENDYTYGIWTFQHGANWIEYLIDEHSFYGWFSKEAWGVDKSYTQSQIDEWRAGWYYGNLEVQVNAVHKPGDLSFFLNGHRVQDIYVSESDVGRKRAFQLSLNKAHLLTTSNHFNIKGCAEVSSPTPPHPDTHAKVDLGPIRFSVLTFPGQADVQLEKTVEPEEIFVGQTARVEVKVTNYGTNVAWFGRFDDSLPAGLELSGGRLDFRQDVYPSESTSLEYVIKATAAGNYTLPFVHMNYKNALGDMFYRDSNASSLLVKEYPNLVVTANLDKSRYYQGEVANLTVTVTDHSEETVGEADVIWRVMSDNSSFAEGNFKTSPDGMGIDTFCVPTLIDSYTLEIVTSKTNYKSDDDSLSFEVDDIFPPTIPLLLLPLNESSTNDSNLTFDWMDSVDVGSGISDYRLQVDNDGNFVSPEIDTVVADSQYTSTDSLNDDRYYWRVRAKDNSANSNLSSWSSEHSFLMDTVFPSIEVTEPTTEHSYLTLESSVTIRGKCADSGGSNLDKVYVINNTNGNDGWDYSFFGPSRYFSVEDIALGLGDNNITVTVMDGAENISNHTILVIRRSVIYVDDDAPNDPGTGTSNDPFRCIQDAIDVAIHGDTILVLDGIYEENVNIKAKNVVLTSTNPNDLNTIANTIIDGISDYESVVRIIDANVRIDGFTIQNGHGHDTGAGVCGGGVYCASETATIFNVVISNNVIRNNRASNPITLWGGSCGGGIYCDNYAQATILGNKIEDNILEGPFNQYTNNTGAVMGGGIYCSASSCIISGNLIAGNNIDYDDTGDPPGTYMGGGVWINDGIISENTITNNTMNWEGGTHSSGLNPQGSGGGIYCAGQSIIIDNKIADNELRFKGYETGLETCAHGAGICAPNCELSFNIVTRNICSANGGHVWGGGEDWNGPSGTAQGGGVFAPSGRLVGNIITNNITFGQGGDGSTYISQGGTTKGGDGTARGGGVYAPGAILENNTIAGNTATGSGGMGYEYPGDHFPELDGASISEGGGIYADSNTVIKNSIVWGNLPAQLAGQDCNNVTYCDIGDGVCIGGVGNTSSDPCFANPYNCDYHLKSRTGRWDYNTKSWIYDAVTSPCIDSGDPNSDWTTELWPHGKRINMGAYGGTTEASMSESGIGYFANLNNDPNEDVNFDDLVVFVGNWCLEGIPLCGDFNRDGIVNFRDFSVFAEKWMRSIIASSPDPADGAVDVPVDVILCWSPGLKATIHQVYFGKDPCAISLVATKQLGFECYDPEDQPGEPDLTASTAYYWQIVEADASNDWPGPVWTFSTVRGEAQPIFPTDGAVIPGTEHPSFENIFTLLDASPGVTAVSFVAYISHIYSEVANRVEDANLGPQLQSNTYLRWVVGLPPDIFPGDPYPSGLVRGTVYYWAVDSEDSRGNKFPGDVWDFAIQGYYAYAPDPPNEANFVPTNALLSWKPGYGVTDHDIYMGTSYDAVKDARYDFNEPGGSSYVGPDEYLVSRTEPNVLVTGLETGIKYYWRVDEVHGRLPPPLGGGTYYIGPVWNFTTSGETSKINDGMAPYHRNQYADLFFSLPTNSVYDATVDQRQALTLR
ncbi:MAG: hypothetical protein ACYS32_06865 [Planctomycetota bacterium]|jgi:hypothetical protein